MILFDDSETIKQALREAIETRQRDMERFVLELERIRKEELEREETMRKQMQQSYGGL